MSERRPSPIDEALDSIGAAFLLLGRCIRDGLWAQRSSYDLAPPPPASPGVSGQEDQE